MTRLGRVAAAVGMYSGQRSLQLSMQQAATLAGLLIRKTPHTEVAALRLSQAALESRGLCVCTYLVWVQMTRAHAAMGDDSASLNHSDVSMLLFCLAI